METVNVAELQTNLAAYLEQVRKGAELIVRDRNRPIARLMPLSASNDLDAQEAALVAAGLMQMPTEELTADFWDMPAPSVSAEAIAAAIQADRDER